MDRVNVYIDGYNFYYGINKEGWLKCGWCNFSKLSRVLATRAFGSSVEVGKVKYFTSPVRDWHEARTGESERQAMWLSAVSICTPEVEVIHGRFQKVKGRLRVEKETDLNIGLAMQADVGLCERMILISGDTDFSPAIRIALAKGVPVVVFVPPNTPVPNLPTRAEQIQREDLTLSHLPDEIPAPNGTRILWSRYQELRAQSRPIPR